MSDPVLTPDNTLLSRPTLAWEGVSHFSAISFPGDFPAAVTGYIRDSLAENSRRAYLSDLAQFESWGGTIPATPETVAAYLADRADTHAVASLVRYIASISKAHSARGLPNPTRSELVKSVLRGIKRTRGCTRREAKPLLRDELLMVLDATGDGLKAVRDRAMLLLGFAGALRPNIP
jgi:integrase